MKTGQSVTYIDEHGDRHAATITKVGGGEPGPRVLDLLVGTGEEQLSELGVKHDSVAGENEPHWIQ